MPVVRAPPASRTPSMRRATAADIARAEALATARRRAADKRGPLKKFLDALGPWWNEVDKNNTSLYVFHERSRFRRHVTSLINWKWFDRTVLAVILTNCVTLAMYDPTQEDDSAWNQSLDVCELIFTFFFMAEFVLQIISRNFAIGPNAYLKNPWSVLDFVVVCAGLLSLIGAAVGMASGASNVTGIRALRALKPLRTLNQVPGVKVLTSTVLDATPMVSGALVALAWLFLVFGIVGVDQFAGGLTGRCFITEGFDSTSNAFQSLGFIASEGNLPCDASGDYLGRVCGVGETCVKAGFATMLDAMKSGDKHSPNPNGGYTSFDTISDACFTIFQTLTKRGWGLVATQIEAGVGSGAFVKSFFASIVLFGSFFAMRVISAIVVAEYARTSTLESRNNGTEPSKITDTRKTLKAMEQSNSNRTSLRSSHARLVSSKSKSYHEYEVETERNDQRRNSRSSFSVVVSSIGQTFTSIDSYLDQTYSYQKALRAVVNHHYFETATTVLVVLNTLAMAVEHHGMDSSLATFLEFLNVIFVLIFAAELVLKLTALGIKQYFSDQFNKFDFVIVNIGLVELLFDFGGGVSALRMFRLVRVLRAAKLFKSSRRARAFSEKIVLDVTAARDLFFVALVFIFIFAILGMQLFGGTHAFNGTPFGKNFDNVGSASISVFEMLTASQWHDTAWRGMDAAGGSSAIYFTAWMFVGHFLFPDVLLAVLAFNFGLETSDEKREREEKEAAQHAKELENDVNNVGSDTPRDKDGLGYDSDGDLAKGVHTTDGGEVVAARVRRRGARQFAKEVQRMKTWLRQTDQAYFDDSGGEEEEVFDDVIVSTGKQSGDNLNFDDGDDGGLGGFGNFNVVSIKDARDEAPKQENDRSNFLQSLKTGRAVPTTQTQALMAEQKALESEGRVRPLDKFKAAGRSVIAARRFAGEGWEKGYDTEDENGVTRRRQVDDEDLATQNLGDPTSPNVDLAVIDLHDLKGVAAEEAAKARAAARHEPGARRASAVSRFLAPRQTKWELAEKRAAEDEKNQRNGGWDDDDFSVRDGGSDAESEDILGEILNEWLKDSENDGMLDEAGVKELTERVRGSSSVPGMGKQSGDEENLSSENLSENQRKEPPRKNAQRKLKLLSGDAMNVSVPEASLNRKKVSLCDVSVHVGTKTKTTSPRQKEETQTLDGGVDMIGEFLTRRLNTHISSSTPRSPPLLQTRPYVSLHSKPGGFKAAVSLATKLASLGKKTKEIVNPESNDEDTTKAKEDGKNKNVKGPGPVTESFRNSPGKADGFDFGDLNDDDAKENDDDENGYANRTAKTTVGQTKDYDSLFKKVTAARAKGVASRRAAATGKAPPERRAFAALLAEGATVAAKAAGTYGNAQVAKIGAEIGQGASIAAKLRRQEFVDGFDDLYTQRDTQDPVSTRLAVAYDQGLGFAGSGPGLSARSPAKSLGATNTLAESVLLRLQTRKEKKEAMPPIRDADKFAEWQSYDISLPLVDKAKKQRLTTNTTTSTFGGKRRHDGVPNRDITVTVPLKARERPGVRQKELTPVQAIQNQTKTNAPIFMKSNSLFFFTPKSPFRRVCFMICFDKVFEAVVVVMILVSSGLIAAENPSVSSTSTLGLALSHMDVIFAVFFSCEAIVKIIAMGLIMHPGAYLRDPWCATDGFVTVASALAVVSSSSAFAAIRAFRVARALRPLRLVKRFRGARVVAASLALAFPKMVDVLLLGLFQHTVFAILGVQLFSGKFWRCTDVSVGSMDECVGSFVVGVDEPNWMPYTTDSFSGFDEIARFGDFGDFGNEGLINGAIIQNRQWVNPVFNFDDVGNALLSLFIITTGDRWMEMTTRGVDATDVNLQPKQNNSPASSLFFISFTVCSTLFWTRLLAACVVDAYRRVSAITGDMVFETPGQKKWADALKMKRRLAEEQRRKEREEKQLGKRTLSTQYAHSDPNPVVTLGGVEPAFLPRALLLRFVRHKYFELFIHLCVLINVGVMASKSSYESGSEISARLFLNDFFGWIFVAEFLLKSVALGIKPYLKDPWNRLDFVVVVGTLPTLVFGVDALGPGVAILRAFRLGRLFRLLKSGDTVSPTGTANKNSWVVLNGICVIFDGLISALPSIANVGVLLFVLLYVFSVLGVTLFGEIGLEGNSGTLTTFIHEECHFGTFPDASYCLFRVMSGDDWSRVMAETFNGCDLLNGFETGEYSSDTCTRSSVILSATFFMTFITLTALITLNVFVAVIVDTFAEAASSEGLMATASFFELLKRKMLLDGFAEALKKRLRKHANDVVGNKERHKRR